MQVNTRAFGPIDVREADVLSFQDGLYGFDTLRRFVLIDIAPDSPCRYLQSLDDPDLSFIVVDPWAVLPDYAPDVPDGELAHLGVDRPEDVLCLVIAVVPEDVQQMTVNLRAPLVINPKTRRARQVILIGDKYPIRHPVFQGKAASRGSRSRRGKPSGEVSAAVAP